jgi:hypothetical protein
MLTHVHKWCMGPEPNPKGTVRSRVLRTLVTRGLDQWALVRLGRSGHMAHRYDPESVRTKWQVRIIILVKQRLANLNQTQAALVRRLGPDLVWLVLCALGALWIAPDWGCTWSS